VACIIDTNGARPEHRTRRRLDAHERRSPIATIVLPGRYANRPTSAATVAGHQLVTSFQHADTTSTSTSTMN
jgi:hypothetical protein